MWNEVEKCIKLLVLLSLVSTKWSGLVHFNSLCFRKIIFVFPQPEVLHGTNKIIVWPYVFFFCHPFKFVALSCHTNGMRVGESQLTPDWSIRTPVCWIPQLSFKKKTKKKKRYLAPGCFCSNKACLHVFINSEVLRRKSMKYVCSKCAIDSQREDEGDAVKKWPQIRTVQRKMSAALRPLAK